MSGCGGANPSLTAGLKVFMDAHSTVTAVDGDRYPIRPPNLYVSSVMAAPRSPKPLVGVRVPGDMQSLLALV